MNSLIQEFQKHSADLIAKLREECREGTQSIRQLMASNLTDVKQLCVTLKCIAGSHIGQRFRLEASTVSQSFYNMTMT